MFFHLAKLGWALLAPLNLIFVLLLLGGVLLFKNAMWGRRVILTAAALFFVVGILPVGPDMLVWLESRYERPATLPERVDGIIVLGGIFETQITLARHTPAINGQVERVLEALALVKKYPRAKIVFSGGNGRWLTQAPPETSDAAQFFKSMGLSDDRVIYEDKSRNTYENAVFSQHLALPTAHSNWVVITSAYHMPRAAGVFRSITWPGTLTFQPVDYMTTGQYEWLPHRFDVLGNVYDFSVAFRELVGIAAYRLTKKIGPVTHQKTG